MQQEAEEEEEEGGDPLPPPPPPPPPSEEWEVILFLQSVLQPTRFQQVDPLMTRRLLPKPVHRWRCARPGLNHISRARSFFVSSLLRLHLFEKGV